MFGAARTKQVSTARPTPSGDGAPNRTFGNAWVLLSLAIGVHVVDEALNGFLDVYNPAVLALRSRLGWFPAPVFTFEVWLGGLIAGVTLLLLLSPLAYRGALFARIVAVPLGVVMIGNAVGHTVGTLLGGTVGPIRFDGPMPGFYSSPLLFAASVYLLISSRGAARYLRAR